MMWDVAMMWDVGCGFVCVSYTSLTSFGDLLRCPHKVVPALSDPRRERPPAVYGHVINVPIHFKVVIHPSDERPPAMYGQFCLVPRVSVHDRYYCTRIVTTVVPVMNGHPRDQAKLSVHCRWPLIRGTVGHLEMNRDIDNVAVHSRWPLTTGVAQCRYNCRNK